MVYIDILFQNLSAYATETRITLTKFYCYNVNANYTATRCAIITGTQFGEWLK
jgi:hypothetical protein